MDNIKAEITGVCTELADTITELVDECSGLGVLEELAGKAYDDVYSLLALLKEAGLG